MQFNVPAENLKHVLGLVGKVVAKKGSMPLYETVEIEAKKGEVVFRAHNGHHYIQAAVGAMVSEIGDACVNGTAFIGAVGKLDGVIVVEQDASHLRVESAGSVYRLGLMNEAFPLAPAVKRKLTSMDDPGAVVRKTAFATGDDENKPYTMAVYLDGEKGLAVASDTACLAMVPVECEGSHLIPKDALALASKLGKLDIHECENGWLLFDGGGGVKLYSAKIEGGFPNYGNLIPDSQDVVATCNREALLGAIGRAMVVRNSNLDAVKIVVEDNQVTVSRKGQSESFEETLDADVQGEGSVLLSGGRMKDYLAVADGDVNVEFNKNLHPSVLRSDGGFLLVLMPIREG